MAKQRTRWNNPRWFIVYTQSSSFEISSRTWPELRPGWVSVKGPFNLKRDAEAERRREIHENADELISQLQDEVARARARLDRSA